MTEPARTLVQTVGPLQIGPSRNSVDRLGIWTAVTLIRQVPSRRTTSRARCRRPWSRFANGPAEHPRCRSRLPNETSVIYAETPPRQPQDRRGWIRSRQGRRETAALANEYPSPPSPGLFVTPPPT